VLLSHDDPAPFDVQGRDGRAPFLIVCDHAGRLLPRALGSLGLTEDELGRHIAWDIGAGAVARRLAALLDAPLVAQRYSRLVIDCNRPLGAIDSIVAESEHTLIPGNLGLDPANAELRAREIFWPYHDQLRDALDDRARRGRRSVFVAMHSFTPIFKGLGRPWHAGVLFNRDRRLGEILLGLLRREARLEIGCNQPYAASELSDYSLVQHGEGRGLPCVELEIRQDLIADEAGQAAWAERLAGLLPLALEALDAEAPPCGDRRDPGGRAPTP
jgi:predicted N-formylglutamate amidohydrolase